MTNQTFPITPPLGLINQWWNEAKQNAKYDEPIGPLVATKAAQWGADQELDACCEQLRKDGWYTAVQDLRAARRPTPKLSSFKKQAYDALDTYIYGEPDPKDKERTYNTIRQALEALPND